jgi:hypothetical protein
MPMQHIAIQLLDLFLQTVMVCVGIILVIKISQLLREGQADRTAREKAVVTLNERALAVEEKAAAIAYKDREALKTHILAVSEKIDENTKLTSETKDTASEALKVANGFNEKIHQTNQRLLEAVGAKLEEEAKTLQTIEGTAKDTLETTKTVDQKIDKLAEPK